MGVGKKVGFAVVGLGTIAQGFVLPSFAKCKNAKLVAVVSRDQHKAPRVARKFKAEAHYSNEEYAACLANPAIDAVFVATPNGLHESFTVRAAQADKHVLCEKPLAATAEQAARMVEACRRNRVLLMTAYRKYFEPSTLCLKQLIQNGDLGRIDVIHTAFSELYSPGKSLPWLVDSHLAGGRRSGGSERADLGARHGDILGRGGSDFLPIAIPQRARGAGELVVRRGFVVLYIRAGDEGLGVANSCISIRPGAAAHGEDRKARDGPEVCDRR